MIELFIGVLSGGVLATGLVWGAVHEHRQFKAFIADLGLTRDTKGGKFSGVVSGVPVQLLFRAQSNGKTSVPFTDLWFKTGPTSLVIKDTPLLDRAGITSSEDFITADAAFDKAFLVQGLPADIAFALGPDERQCLLTLKLGGKVQLKHGTLFVTLPTHNRPQVREAFDLCARLSVQLTKQQAELKAVLLERLKDPHLQMRAAAQLALAELSKSEDDILAVSAKALHPPHQLRLWTLARASRANTALTVFKKLINQQHAPLLSALLCEVAVFNPAIDDALLYPLLSHDDEDIRITTALRLGELGTIAAVPHLRALELSSMLARKQVNIARQAIAAIQTRAGSGDLAGAVSRGDDASGALSKEK